MKDKGQNGFDLGFLHNIYLSIYLSIYIYIYIYIQYYKLNFNNILVLFTLCIFISFINKIKNIFLTKIIINIIIFYIINYIFTSKAGK